MNETVDIEFEYTVDDYVRGNEFLLSRTFFFKYIQYIAGIPTVLILLIVIYWLEYDPSHPYQWLIPVSLVGVFTTVILFLCNPLLKKVPNPGLKWVVSSQYKSSPLLKEKQFVTFSNEGISAETALSESLTKWGAILEIFETKNDFFFFTSNRSALFVPKTYLVPHVEDQIRMFCRVKRGDKAKLLM